MLDLCLLPLVHRQLLDKGQELKSYNSQVKTTMTRSWEKRAVWNASLSLPTWMSDWLFCWSEMFFASG